MSLQEKLTTVCSQSDGIYIKGYETGENHGYQNGFTEGEAAGMEAGRQAEKDALWDNRFKNIKNASYLFAGQGWNDETFTPAYDIVTCDSEHEGPYPRGIQADYMFSYSNVTDIVATLEAHGVKLDTSPASSLMGLFSFAKTRAVPTINASHTLYIDKMFYHAENLVTIEKVIWPTSMEQSISYVFGSCPSLEHVVIEGTIKRSGLNVQWSPKLTVESLVSILEALADHSDKPSTSVYKITLGSENIAKLTTEQLASAENKGWTVV